METWRKLAKAILQQWVVGPALHSTGHNTGADQTNQAAELLSSNSFQGLHPKANIDCRVHRFLPLDIVTTALSKLSCKLTIRAPEQETETSWCL